MVITNKWNNGYFVIMILLINGINIKTLLLL